MAEDAAHEGYAPAAGTGALKGAESLLQDAGKAMLKDAPRRTRYVLRRIPGAPGLIYDIANFATAKDKLRAGVGIAGGVVGGFAGEAAGPVGAAVGSAAGEAGAEWLYDHHDELARKVADTAQWMKERGLHVAGQAAHGFDRGMPPYSTPLR